MHDPDRSKGIRKAELMDLLLHADKDIFKSFRDKQLSMSQLKARVYTRRFKMDYTCFDDIKDLLDPDWVDPKKKAKFAPKMKMIFGDDYTPENL